MLPTLTMLLPLSVILLWVLTGILTLNMILEQTLMALKPKLAQLKLIATETGALQD